MRLEIPALTNDIKLDAVLDDWAGEHCTADFVEFDICTACVGGATYEGIWDHSAAAFGWSAANLYAGMMVYDDDGRQNAISGWKGDSVQIMFTTAARDPAGNSLTQKWVTRAVSSPSTTACTRTALALTRSTSPPRAAARLMAPRRGGGDGEQVAEEESVEGEDP